MSDNHELFTELSFEQAAVVEGGLRLQIQSIECIKAGADDIFGGGDDLFININGRFFAGNFNMKGGFAKTINRVIHIPDASIAVDLFDDDGISQPDFLGGFTARPTGGNLVSKRVSGSGSKYRIFYRAL
jgi:hypothetical protein